MVKLKTRIRENKVAIRHQQDSQHLKEAMERIEELEVHTMKNRERYFKWLFWLRLESCKLRKLLEV
mgnify:FL=1